MKKLFALLCVLMLLLPMAGCTAEDKTPIRLGALKGATSIGLLKLLEDAEQGTTQNPYQFTMAASADELTPKLLMGQMDVLAVPANLASVLYNITDKRVRFLAVNTLGVLYIVEKGGESVRTVEDLKGRTVYATGKGSTPEYALTHLLRGHGLDIKKDVTVEWKSEPTETVAALNASKDGIAMLPQPFVTVAMGQVEGLHTALDLTKEWDALDDGSRLITAGLIVRADFAQQHPEAVKTFLEEFRASAAYANEHVEETAALAEKYGIVKAVVAKKAIPACNIVCLDGAEMKIALEGYLQALYEQNPAAVGGAVPEDDFYYCP